MSSANSSKFIAGMQHPIKSRVFLFANLPSAFFSGVRVRNLSEQSCEVTVPFKWFSKNPFRSTYFACLAMAGELSTGALSLAHIYGRKPAVSMLVVKMEAKYYKKAISRTHFVCQDGDLIKKTIEAAIADGASHEFTTTSTGKNPAGELVAEFFVTWSFKAKAPKPPVV